MLGLQERIIGRFAKVYANVGDDVRRAFTAFAEEVRAGAFPDEEHSYAMAKDVIAQLRESITLRMAPQIVTTRDELRRGAWRHATRSRADDGRVACGTPLVDLDDRPARTR